MATGRGRKPAKSNGRRTPQCERAGKQPWGYVEPTEAVWEALCCGIVVGLYRAEGEESDGPLGWAPDSPAEEACHAVVELIRAGTR